MGTPTKPTLHLKLQHAEPHALVWGISQRFVCNKVLFEFVGHARLQWPTLASSGRCNGQQRKQMTLQTWIMSIMNIKAFYT